MVEARAKAEAACEMAWRGQRKANDWAGFKSGFAEVLRLARQAASALGEALGVSPYEGLMAQYEPDLRMATVERLFGELSSFLPDFTAQVLDKQASEEVLTPQARFPRRPSVNWVCV